MKKLFFAILIGFIFSSCGEPKVYELAVKYTNGQSDTLKLYGEGRNLFSIKNSDLIGICDGVGGITIASGVRSFTVISFGTAKLQCSKYLYKNMYNFR